MNDGRKLLPILILRPDIAPHRNRGSGKKINPSKAGPMPNASLLPKLLATARQTKIPTIRFTIGMKNRITHHRGMFRPLLLRRLRYQRTHHQKIIHHSADDNHNQSIMAQMIERWRPHGFSFNSPMPATSLATVATNPIASESFIHAAYAALSWMSWTTGLFVAAAWGNNRKNIVVRLTMPNTAITMLRMPNTDTRSDLVSLTAQRRAKADAHDQADDRAVTRFRAW